MSARQPAVAGMFYPGTAPELGQTLTDLLAAAPAPPHDAMPPKVLIVPHAGYVYSGPVAAEVYRRVQPHRDRYRRVVLVGPAHRVYLEGLAVPRSDAFTTPLGDVPVDTRATTDLCALPQVGCSDIPHRDEHCVEVQVPFLQTVLGEFELVPIVVGQADPGDVAEVLDALWGGPDTLIVISSDLSHFLPYEAARRRDEATCDRILEGRSDLSGEEACGAGALNGLALAEHRAGLAIELVDMKNSGDTAGAKDSVVGYGGFVLGHA